MTQTGHIGKHETEQGCLLMNDDLFPAQVKGGIARSKALSKERRSEIAKKGSQARWGVKASHRGNFKEELGIDAECYVLEDVQKTAVISQTGMARVLGLSPRGNALLRFLAGKIMSGSLSAEIQEKVEKPLKFQWTSLGAGTPAVTVHGFDSALLIDICKAIISVEDKLGPRYATLAKQAHLIVGASARLGIRGLVYALAGYNPTTEEVIEAFRLYVLEEAKKYEPEFPNELYLQWHRLYELDVPERGKPWYFKYLTVNHVYYPVAKSNGKLLTLLRANKAKGGDRKKKLFQFLNDIGARALRIQLGRVLEMAESSPDKYEYERKIAERFGGQQAFELIVPPEPSTASPPPFGQSQPASA
jgi:P63C domain-containing protein